LIFSVFPSVTTPFSFLPAWRRLKTFIFVQHFPPNLMSHASPPYSILYFLQTHHSFQGSESKIDETKKMCDEMKQRRAQFYRKWYSESCEGA
jgi:hypothetical protein